MDSTHFSLMRENVHYVVVDNGCWEWQGPWHPQRYGRSIGTLRKTTGEERAARASYVLANGPIPEGHDVHHQCENPPCVNPAHLEAIDAWDHVILHKLERKTGLSLDDVAEIRRLGRVQGVFAKDVADQYGIHWRTVDDYWGSRRWESIFDDGPCRPTCTCPVCGGEFVAEKRRHQVYCSKRCYARANYVVQRDRKAA